MPKEQVLEVMGDRALKRTEIYALLHWHPAPTVNTWISRLHSEKLIYIERWAEEQDADQSRPYVRAVYRAGEGEDAPRPNTITQAEYDRRHTKPTNSVFSHAATFLMNWK